MRKKVLCMFFLLFVFSSAYSLVSAKYTERIDSIITDVNMYGMMKYVFLYDAEGLLSEKIAYSQEEMDGKWTVSERRGYGYDEDDRISSVVVTDVLNEGVFFFEEYTYDGKGNLSSISYKTKEMKDEVKKMNALREFLYNEKGFLVGERRFRYQNGERKEDARNEREYDKKGRLLVINEYVFSNHQKTLFKRTRYSYSKNGLLVTKEEQLPDAEKQMKRDLIERRRYDEHQRLVALSFDRGDESSDVEFCYDKKGNLIQIIDRRSINGVEEYVGCTSFAYDQNAPVSSVMGLSSPEVLSTDWALRYEMNLTSKPISVTAEMGISHPHQEKSLYYYSAISGE